VVFCCRRPSYSRSAVVSAASRGREAGRCLVIAGPVDHRAASTRYPHTLVLDTAVQIAAAPVFLKEGAEGHKEAVPGRTFEECHVRECRRRPRRAPAQRRTSTSARLEPFHLGRYVDEQAFRFNERSRRHGDAGRFMGALRTIVGPRLMYKD